jgi:D-threo-aldose 1-dehydrogenase
MTMPVVALPNTDMRTTVIGFGCSGLLGPTPRRDGLRLLETAYDAGIRHFDVARYYGFGDAEGLVGDLLKAHPGEVTVTTKFGMSPDRRVARLRPVVNVARRMMRASSFVRKAIRSQIRNVVRSGAFSVEQARASLETSRRALRVSRLDLWLLHECRPDDCAPELLDFLRGAVAEGTVGAFGIATTFEHTQVVCRARPEFARVVQFDSNVLNRNLDRLDRSTPRGILIHGAIADAFGRLRQFLADRPDRSRAWSQAGDANCSDPIVLAGLMLSHVAHANPGGVVLFRSTRPEAIRANVRAIAEGTYAPAQVRTFADMVTRDVTEQRT